MIEKTKLSWTTLRKQLAKSREERTLRAPKSNMVGTLRDMKPQLRNVKKLVATALPIVVLATPSFWLMLAVPPLWRVSDAYVQTVYPPGAATILAHGPLYCTLSRVPLWFGYLMSGAGPAVGLGHFIKHTQLTDAGVFALLFLQHATLWCAALYFINAITATLSARLLLAIFFGSHPLFYTFAHCVGSETLSMIVAVFLAGAGLRIVLRYPDIIVRDWIIFGALLCSSILTRHINCVLAALLPLTMFLIAVGNYLRIFVVQLHARSTAHFELGKAARVWGTSIAIGVAALILATSITHLLCWRAHIHWRSNFGYTFVWRLNFLERVPATSRDEFLSATASKCQLPETRELLAMLANWFGQNKRWNPAQFVREAGAALFSSSGKFQAEKFDRCLNEMAYTFLSPPSAALRSAALDDFEYATQLREADLAHFLFVTTDYFFNRPSRTPQLAQLKTFREPRTELIDASKGFYFRWWNPISFRAGSVIALFLLLVTCLMNIKFKTAGGSIILYAAALFTVGVIMVLLNCFFVEIKPRFSLPMMEFLLLSIMILLSLIFRGCTSVSRGQSSQNLPLKESRCCLLARVRNTSG